MTRLKAFDFAWKWQLCFFPIRTSVVLTESAAGRIVLGVLKRFKRPVVAMVLVLSVGLHWPLLQSVAWMSMLVSFSQEGGIEQAISKTFDGKHPCRMCKLVTEGKKAEHKQAQLSLIKKDQVACLFSMARFENPEIFLAHTSFAEVAISRQDPPLRLPPDAA